MSELIELGIITTAHALKGEVKVMSYTDSADKLLEYRQFIIQPRDHSLPTQLTIEQARVIGEQSILIKFKEIKDRTMAEQFRQVKLWATQAQVQQINSKAPGEYYEFELINMQVLDAQGKILGTVEGIADYGAGKVLEIQAQEGVDFTLPLNPEFILDINTVTKQMTVKNPNLSID